MGRRPDSIQQPMWGFWKHLTQCRLKCSEPNRTQTNTDGQKPGPWGLALPNVEPNKPHIELRTLYWTAPVAGYILCIPHSVAHPLQVTMLSSLNGSLSWLQFTGENKTQKAPETVSAPDVMAFSAMSPV